MINPTISKLLGGVATSLDETVLPELEPGFARNQLVAAIALIRRAATVDERIGGYLWEDNRDITAVLSEVAPLVGLDPPSITVDAGYPTLEELRRRNLALQHQLVPVAKFLTGHFSVFPFFTNLFASERYGKRRSRVSTTNR